jgi:hypothetical protein
MVKAPAFQFYVKDWLSDTQLRLTALSTRGIWIDLLCFMWEAPERGKIETTIENLMRMVGANNGEMEQFIKDANELGFCDILESNAKRNAKCNANVTDCHKKITVYNRRMFRTEKQKEDNRLRQQRHRVKRKSNAKVTLHSSSPIKKEKRKKIFRNGNKKSFSFKKIDDDIRTIPDAAEHDTTKLNQGLAIYLQSDGDDKALISFAKENGLNENDIAAIKHNAGM